MFLHQMEESRTGRTSFMHRIGMVEQDSRRNAAADTHKHRVCANERALKHIKHFKYFTVTEFCRMVPGYRWTEFSCSYRRGCSTN